MSFLSRAALAVPATALALIGAGPAAATGGFDCVAEDANIAFAASAAVGRGVPSGFLNFQATADIKWNDLPEDLRKPDMVKALTQSWFVHPDLKMQFYTERQDKEPFASLEILIETKAIESDEIAYEGAYVMKLFENASPEARSAEVTGKVTCSGE